MRKTLLGLSALAAFAVLGFAEPAAADTVTDWWEFANKISPFGSPRPPEQERVNTQVTLAMFEALNAIDRRYQSYLALPQGDPSASQDAAAATAAYRVLLHHFPAQKALLEENHAIAMSAVRDEKKREAGRAIGEQAAAAAVKSSGLDPAIVQTPYRPRATPGVWVPTGLPTTEPYWAAFKPWAIPSADALRAPPPPALASATWARDYEEVRRLGSKTSTERTVRQTLMARYRQAFDLTPTLRMIADQPGRRPVQNARMLTLYHMALDDAAQAMIVDKLHYNYWRPITAIRNGEDDGNPATEPDPAWVPLIATPNFPEYPCGHCTAVGAIATVMKAETGPSPAGGVKVGAMGVPNAAVHYLPSWDEWAQEVSDSRIYGGVHYRFSNEAGEEIGRRAARMVLDKVARPLAGKGR